VIDGELTRRQGRPIACRAGSRALVALLLACALGFAAGTAGAEEVIDFESLPPDLPGWSAYGSDPEGKRQYRAAAKWDVPFTVVLDSDMHHTGSISLKCEVSQETDDVSIAAPILPASGSAEIRFFVRTSGISGPEGAFHVGEINTEGKSFKGYTSMKIGPSDNEWTEVVWTGQLDPQTVGVRMMFNYKVVPAGAKIWLDDISVKAAGN
jgi:hypothetical protein